MKIGIAGGEAGQRLVAIDGPRVFDLLEIALAAAIGPADVLSTLRAFLEAGPDGREVAVRALDVGRSGGGWAQDLDSIQLFAPVAAGAKILCHVINYSHHGPAGVPRRPFFFYKPSSAILGPGEPIEPHTSMSTELDFETELAVVIGRVARDVDPAMAYDFVAGYTIVNDVSYRDNQFNKTDPDLSRRYGMNWTQGKGLDGSCPVGPWIVLSDGREVPYPRRIRCWVNGELRQDASTDDMVHKVPALIAEVTRGMTLYPGDVIATGTPSGTGLDDGRYLTRGDVVRCDIEGIGVLQNAVGA